MLRVFMKVSTFVNPNTMCQIALILLLLTLTTRFVFEGNLVITPSVQCLQHVL